MICDYNSRKNKQHTIEMNHAYAFFQEKISQKTTEKRKRVINHASFGRSQNYN
jgi:hypothetical protein